MRLPSTLGVNSESKPLSTRVGQWQEGHPGPGLPAPRGRSGLTLSPLPRASYPHPSPAQQCRRKPADGQATAQTGTGCWEQILRPMRLPLCVPVTLLGTLASPLHPTTDRLRDLEQVAWLFRAPFFCLRSQVGPAPPRAVGAARTRGPGAFRATSSPRRPSLSHSQSERAGEVGPKPLAHPERDTVLCLFRLRVVTGRIGAASPWRAGPREPFLRKAQPSEGLTRTCTRTHTHARTYTHTAAAARMRTSQTPT